MSKGYLYLASDGVDDYYKFGITNCLNTRLISYNTTYFLGVRISCLANNSRNISSLS